MNKKAKIQTNIWKMPPPAKRQCDLTLIACIALIPLIILATVAIGLSIIKLDFSKQETRYYEYMDLQDEWGIATQCFYKSSDGYLGAPICITEDGTVVLVKLYKDMTEEVENAR